MANTVKADDGSLSRTGLGHCYSPLRLQNRSLVGVGVRGIVTVVLRRPLGTDHQGPRPGLSDCPWKPESSEAH